MTAPSTVHESMLRLLLADKQLALDLVTLAAQRQGLAFASLELEHASFELERTFERDEQGKRNKPYRLFPDLVLTIRDRDGNIIAAWIIENQLKVDEGKTYRLPAYRAGAQVHFEMRVDLLGVSPNPRVREWLEGLKDVIYDPPVVLDLEMIGRVCNPRALWLTVEGEPGPEHTDAQLQAEVAIARARPYAALFHAVHHVKDERAYQIVLAALIAARDLPIDQRRQYTTMILDAASKTMQELLESKWNDLYPDEELSDWEKEGASYQNGRAEGEAKGRAEGEAKGREKLRKILLGFLQVRGFTVDATTREQIERCTDLDRLQRWCERAMTIDRLERLLDEDPS